MKCSNGRFSRGTEPGMETGRNVFRMGIRMFGAGAC